MDVRILEDAEAVAQEAAVFIASTLREVVAARGLATLALSGGRTPARMLALLADQSVPWLKVHLFQTDERRVASDDAARNARSLRHLLTERVPLPPQQAHWMPVELTDPEEACRSYQATLRAVAGSPPRLDLIHLGLGADGHTASLFPEDRTALDRGRDAAAVPAHGGWPRITLTAPVLEAARHLLWVVCGIDKRWALRALLRADPSTPAGRLPQERALLIADRTAGAQELPSP